MLFHAVGLQCKHWGSLALANLLQNSKKTIKIFNQYFSKLKL
jgi:hypothetical protein